MESTSSTTRFLSKLGPCFLRVHISDRFGMKSTQSIMIYTNLTGLNYLQPWLYLEKQLTSITDNINYHDGVILIDAFSSLTSTVLDQRSVNKHFFCWFFFTIFFNFIKPIRTCLQMSENIFQLGKNELNCLLV